MRAVSILAALFALAVPAPAAFAQTASPFGPLPPAQTTPAPAPQPLIPTRPRSTHPNDQQVSPLGVLALFVAGVLVIVGIGFLIMRDARRSVRRPKRRRRAPAPTPATSPGSSKRPPPRRPSANARKRRKRQKRRAR